MDRRRAVLCLLPHERQAYEEVLLPQSERQVVRFSEEETRALFGSKAYADFVMRALGSGLLIEAKVVGEFRWGRDPKVLEVRDLKQRVLCSEMPKAQYEVVQRIFRAFQLPEQAMYTQLLQWLRMHYPKELVEAFANKAVGYQPDKPPPKGLWGLIFPVNGTYLPAVPGFGVMDYLPSSQMDRKVGIYSLVEPPEDASTPPVTVHAGLEREVESLPLAQPVASLQEYESLKARLVESEARCVRLNGEIMARDTEIAHLKLSLEQRQHEVTVRFVQAWTEAGEILQRIQKEVDEHRQGALFRELQDLRHSWLTKRPTMTHEVTVDVVRAGIMSLDKLIHTCEQGILLSDNQRERLVDHQGRWSRLRAQLQEALVGFAALMQRMEAKTA